MCFPHQVLLCGVTVACPPPGAALQDPSLAMAHAAPVTGKTTPHPGSPCPFPVTDPGAGTLEPGVTPVWPWQAGGVLLKAPQGSWRCWKETHGAGGFAFADDLGEWTQGYTGSR